MHLRDLSRSLVGHGILIAISLPITAYSKVDVCESLKSIVDRATDEVCQFQVDAAESCYEKINLRYIYFKKRGDETSTKALLQEGNLLKSDYESGLVTLRSYIKDLKDDECGDEKEQIKVVIETFETELSDIKKRLVKLDKYTKKAR